MSGSKINVWYTNTLLSVKKGDHIEYIIWPAMNAMKFEGQVLHKHQAEYGKIILIVGHDNQEISSMILRKDTEGHVDNAFHPTFSYDRDVLKAWQAYQTEVI